MNFDFRLKDDQCWYDVQLLETKEQSDLLIDGKNFKITVEGWNGDSSKIQEAKIRLSQLNVDDPVTLRKLYATIINTCEENLKIDSKFLSVNSINELVTQNLGIDEGTVVMSQKNHLDIPINHSQYKSKIWKDVTNKKINSIQAKINEKVDVLAEFEHSWDKLSVYEKVSLIATNASLGSFSRIGIQEELQLEIKKYKIELLEAMFQDHQLSSVFDVDSKNNEQNRIEQMATTAISIEQIAFLKGLLPKLESKSPLLLMVSMATNSKEAIRLVIQNGVNPNSNFWNKPILYWACLRGVNDAIETLLECGADPNITENNEHSILHKAFESEKTTMKSLNLLLDKTKNINIKNAEGQTLLHSVAQYGNTGQDLQRTDMLVNANIGVNIQDKTGQTALHTAIKENKNNLAMVTKLIEANCIVDIFDLYSKTALHYAAEKASIDDDSNLESTQIIMALIEKGATVNMQDISGKTPLHYIAEGTKKSNNAALELLKHGANLDIQDEEGNTALHTAVKSGNIELIEILLKAGADRNIRNKEGHLPGALAVHGLHVLFLTDNEKEKILMLLSKHEWT